MSVSAKEAIAGVRMYCGMPDHKQLPNWKVLLTMHDKLDNLRAAMLNTDQNWFLSQTYVYVDPGSDIINVTASDFGKPILIHTVDETDPQHVKREVPIIDLQDEDRLYTGPQTGYASGPSPHVAQSFALFRTGTRWQLKVQPQHTESATYSMWHEPNRPVPPALNDNINLIDAFINLLKVDTALSCLPNCLYANEKGEVLNAAEMKMRQGQLMLDKTEYRQQFDRYIATSKQEQTSRKRGYGDGDGMWNY